MRHALITCDACHKQEDDQEGLMWGAARDAIGFPLDICPECFQKTFSRSVGPEDRS